MIESTADRATREATELSTRALARIRSETLPAKRFEAAVGVTTAQVQTQGTPPNRGAEGILRAYSSSPWLRAVTGRIAYLTAAVPWQLFRRGSDDPIEEHPFLDFLDNEIPDRDLALSDPSRLSGFDARFTIQLQLDLVGEGFGLVESTLVGNLPTETQPIPPHWVRRTPKRGQSSYLVRPPGSAIDVEVPSEFMLWLRDPDPFNPYGRGSGIGIALADEIETDEYMARHTKTLFFNGARPDILMVAEGAKQQEINRFRENWNEQLQGYWNQHKTHVIGRKVEIHDLQKSLKDQTFGPIREFERNVFIHVYGMAPEVIGLVENSNRATIDSADYMVMKYVVVPRLVRWQPQYQRIARRFDENLEVRFLDPVPENTEDKRTTMVAMPHAYRVNEWRKLSGDEPLTEDEGGELFLGPGLTIANEAPAGGAFDEPEPEPPVPDDDDDEEEEPEEASTAGRTKAIAADDVDSILRAVDDEVLVRATRPIARSTVVDFAAETLSAFSEEPLQISPRLRRYVEEISASRIRGVGRTVRGKLRKELLASIAGSETQDELERRVRSVFRSASGPRARTIARTESVAAASFGTEEGFVQGGVERKQWLSTRDEVTRDTHAPGTGLDGAVVDVGTDFVSPSGASGPGPGEMSSAAESVNCRCVLLAVVVERSYSEAQKIALWKTADSKRLPYERRYRSALASAFARLRDATLEAVR